MLIVLTSLNAVKKSIAERLLHDLNINIPLKCIHVPEDGRSSQPMSYNETVAAAYSRTKDLNDEDGFISIENGWKNGNTDIVVMLYKPYNSHKVYQEFGIERLFTPPLIPQIGDEHFQTSRFDQILFASNKIVMNILY